MKKHFVLSILLIISFSLQSSTKSSDCPNIYLNEHTYQKQAMDWLRDYILDYEGNLLIYPKEVQLIANLIYFSFKRSYCTLQGQEISLPYLDTLWRGWQNMAQTRLDPSKEQPYTFNDYEKSYDMAYFWHIHDEHMRIGKTYAKTVESFKEDNILLSITAADSVKHMRNQARTVVAQSIIDVRNYIGELFYTDKMHTKQNTKSLNFIDFLYSYIPQLAVSSFVEANKANDIVSEESWNILMKIQQVGVQTWHMIEQERASFYLAFYKAIWHAIRILDAEDDYLYIIFDQNGLLSIDQQYQFLPEPEIVTDF
ncbi:hypothetical protein ACFLYA_00105 [Candidatus Dependentiae bacterium]